jgi:hypothetical protein
MSLLRIEERRDDTIPIESHSVISAIETTSPVLTAQPSPSANILAVTLISPLVEVEEETDGLAIKSDDKSGISLDIFQLANPNDPEPQAEPIEEDIPELHFDQQTIENEESGHMDHETNENAAHFDDVAPRRLFQSLAAKEEPDLGEKIPLIQVPRIFVVQSRSSSLSSDLET